MFVLEKCSLPNTWEFKSPPIEEIYEKLDSQICRGCKMTEQELRKLDDPDFDVEEEIRLGMYKPDTYEEWSALEKVWWLLETPCGCEYAFYEDID